MQQPNWPQSMTIKNTNCFKHAIECIKTYLNLKATTLGTIERNKFEKVNTFVFHDKLGYIISFVISMNIFFGCYHCVITTNKPMITPKKIELFMDCPNYVEEPKDKSI